MRMAATLRESFETLGIASHFGAIVVSAHAGHVKPHPHPEADAVVARMPALPRVVARMA